ncbi:MAG: hypothetical protein HY954_00110 [Deltaproteobacteria bacterium]|nr:hypothetical protein [Deltaproteobacteria bacterium]
MKNQSRTRLYTSVLLSLFAIFVLTSCSKTEVQNSSLRGGETRETLSPANYTGETARAYQAAREIPEVIDSLYCYCDCKKHFDHKSLLTCYVDEHAVHCDICIEEALMAYDLHKQGKDVKLIREAVDSKFSSLRH